MRQEPEAQLVELLALLAQRKRALQRLDREQLRQQQRRQVQRLPRKRRARHLRQAELAERLRRGLARHPIAAEARLGIVAARMTADSTFPWAMSAKSIRLAEPGLGALEQRERRPIVPEESSRGRPIAVAGERWLREAL